MFEHDLVFKREELVDRCCDPRGFPFIHRRTSSSDHGALGSDDGTITIDWAFPPDPPPGSPPAPPPSDIPTVVVFPGLAGHSGKDYIRSIAARVTRFLRARVCVLNWRGFNCKLTSHKVRGAGAAVAVSGALQSRPAGREHRAGARTSTERAHARAGAPQRAARTDAHTTRSARDRARSCDFDCARPQLTPPPPPTPRAPCMLRAPRTVRQAERSCGGGGGGGGGAGIRFYL